MIHVVSSVLVQLYDVMLLELISVTDMKDPLNIMNHSSVSLEEDQDIKSFLL